MQPEELPIAAVRMEKIPESSTTSDAPVAYTGLEVIPELTEVTPAMGSCKFSRQAPSTFHFCNWDPLGPQPETISPPRKIKAPPLLSPE
ncbi:hypothetical protein TNIN_381071 [Trichonephila inaurata madagascariensis]|uniref:Uncharacterized protein n=1 Tax=Trichonephila inaurata madagascariensis TaxID=2747483 RepID=A0A8X6XLY9_9ARAC|nr:hypothetical protein TNIN_381071 [Trichonephila inaurata madagascariensis]